MENRERPDLTDPELDALLQTWKAPMAPARLRSAVFPTQSAPWYRRWWSVSIRVPVPAAAVVCLLLLVAGWWWGANRQRAGAKSVRSSIASTSPTVTFQGFLPVAELRPRIIRSHHASN